MGDWGWGIGDGGLGIGEACCKACRTADSYCIGFASRASLSETVDSTVRVRYSVRYVVEGEICDNATGGDRCESEPAEPARSRHYGANATEWGPQANWVHWQGIKGSGKAIQGGRERTGKGPGRDWERKGKGRGVRGRANGSQARWMVPPTYGRMAR